MGHYTKGSGGSLTIPPGSMAAVILGQLNDSNNCNDAKAPLPKEALGVDSCPLPWQVLLQGQAAVPAVNGPFGEI